MRWSLLTKSHKRRRGKLRMSKETDSIHLGKIRISDKEGIMTRNKKVIAHALEGHLEKVKAHWLLLMKVTNGAMYCEWANEFETFVVKKKVTHPEKGSEAAVWTQMQ
jgi:hypothetical protein